MLRRGVTQGFRSCVLRSVGLHTTTSFVPAYHVVERDDIEEEGDQRIGLMLHGLMGNADNWQRTMKSFFSSFQTKFKIKFYNVDLRHHGESTLQPTQPSNNNTMEACAEDLIQLCDSKLPCPPHFIIGHSMGGKIALEYAKQSLLPPKKVICLDSFPSIVPKSLESGSKSSFESISVQEMFTVLNSISLPIESRSTLKKILLEKGFPLPLAIWMTTNIRNRGNREEGFVWKFKLDALPELYESYKNLCMWDILQNPPEGCEIDFIRGELSSRWTSETISEFEDKIKHTPTTNLIELKKAGHWMHVDNNPGLVELLYSSLSNL